MNVTSHTNSSAAERFFSVMDAMFATRAGEVLAALSDGPLTYRDCRDTMLDLSVAFGRIGLVPGNRALILSRDDRQVITLFLAMLRTGITPVIADPEATDAECAELARLCDVTALFADEVMARPDTVTMVTLGPGRGAALHGGTGHALAKLCDGPRPEGFPELAQIPDVAMLVLTSGTTSQPKAVELTHGNLVAQMDIFAEVYGFGPQIRLLNLLPLHHVDGLIRGPLAALWFGGQVDRWTAFSVQNIHRILKSVPERAITHLITVPAMLRMIERVGRDTPDAFKTPHFAFVLASADMLDASLWTRVEERFGVPVANAYGLSEVVCDALFAGPEAATRRIGTIGRPVGCTAHVVGADGADVADGEMGELVLSGPTVMRGYFGASEATAAVLRDGRFQTGDYVRQTAEGLLEFVGRKKTAIVSGGATIHPEAATQALSTMPGVLEAVAFGVPDAAMGERLVAAIVPVDGHVITAAAAADWCRTLLSPERTPRDFRILSALPRTASGKVILSELQAPVPDVGANKADVLAVAARCFNQPVERLSPGSTPFNTEGWDSLAHMALIEALEDAFGIQFSAMQIAQIMSLGDAQAAINETLAADQ